MTNRNKIILLVSAILIQLCSNAQFRYSATLDSIKESGFYSITITPELAGYLKTDLSDFRIINERKEWVPFIIEFPFHRKSHTPVLLDNKIIRKENKGSETVLVIENEGKLELSNLELELKSAAAERIASLSGSDNDKEWFVILDSLLLQKSDEYAGTSHRQRINFPTNNYRYLKLTIYNNKKQPLNILKASSSMTMPSGDTVQPFLPNPPPTFTQTDSANFSMIKIVSHRPFQTALICIEISSPLFYKREAKLFTRLKNSLPSTWSSASKHSFTITSGHFSGHEIPLLKADTLYLLIDNGDNPTLKISSITTAVINRRGITFLEKGKTYSILTDNPEATTPVYDLEHFKDSIVAPSPLSIGKMIELPRTTSSSSPKGNDNIWIWPVILLILILLSFMTWKLTSDIKRKTD